MCSTLEASKASEIEDRGEVVGNLGWFGRERFWIGGDLWDLWSFSSDYCGFGAAHARYW